MEPRVHRVEVGRTVHYYPGEPGAQKGPWTAKVAHVHSDRMVNLMVIDPNGSPSGRTSVPFRQPDDKPPENGAWREWMPWSLSQMRKAKDAEDTARLREAIDNTPAGG